jgi:hypothetical protein
MKLGTAVVIFAVPPLSPAIRIYRYGSEDHSFLRSSFLAYNIQDKQPDSHPGTYPNNEVFHSLPPFFFVGFAAFGSSSLLPTCSRRSNA